MENGVLFHNGTVLGIRNIQVTVYSLTVESYAGLDSTDFDFGPLVLASKHSEKHVFYYKAVDEIFPVKRLPKTELPDDFLA